MSLAVINLLFETLYFTHTCIFHDKFGTSCCIVLFNSVELIQSHFGVEVVVAFVFCGILELNL